MKFSQNNFFFCFKKRTGKDLCFFQLHVHSFMQILTFFNHHLVIINLYIDLSLQLQDEIDNLNQLKTCNLIL